MVALVLFIWLGGGGGGAKKVVAGRVRLVVILCSNFSYGKIGLGRLSIGPLRRVVIL